uniref:N-alpha-acetyltransferase 38, NatC auxiliary subunit n=8 Tax=Pecora TaxID=35500 RepID=A0AAA9T627_BOVIN
MISNTDKVEETEVPRNRKVTGTEKKERAPPPFSPFPEELTSLVFGSNQWLISWPATSTMGFNSKSPGKEQPPSVLAIQEPNTPEHTPDAGPKCGPYPCTPVPTGLGCTRFPGRERSRYLRPPDSKVLRKLTDLEEARERMAGAGPTMLLREENGCCSRRQSSSSAGDSDGEREEDSPAARARQQLEALLNKTMRIRMTDGRTLVGCFLCTDRDCNVILGSAQEFLKPSDSFSAGEPRVLGLAMVPGHHIVSIEVQRESLAGPPYL